MPYSNHKLDREKLKTLPDEAADHLVEKNSGLIDDLGILPGSINSLSAAVETIIGATPEEKLEMKNMFTKIRAIVHFTSVKKLNALGLTVMFWLFSGIAERFGINLKLIGPLVNKLIEHLSSLP